MKKIVDQCIDANFTMPSCKKEQAKHIYEHN